MPDLKSNQSTSENIPTQQKSVSPKRPKKNLKTLILTQRQQCDVELIINGGFRPLESFLDEQDYHSVLENMRLANGDVWPIPVCLDVDKLFANSLSLGERVALCDNNGRILAELILETVYKIDKDKEAISVYGTNDKTHPGVSYLFNETKEFYLSGRLHKKNLTYHSDFAELRRTPKQLKKLFKDMGWSRVVAFQTRNPMHRAHVELVLQASKIANANILIHPSVGMTKPGDIDYRTRVRAYKKVMRYFPQNSSILSLLPLAMRMAGPREAMWHAIIRKNYGATHFIVGRDHAGPGLDKSGKPFYKPDEAKELVQEFEKELDIKILGFDTMVYVPGEAKYKTVSSLSPKTEFMSISGTNMRKMLNSGEDLPDWFTYKEVSNELKNSKIGSKNKNFTIFFTGLSAAGKSSIASALSDAIESSDNKKTTILDGDEVRKRFAHDLGFTRADRDLNVIRVAKMARDANEQGENVICALIAPFDDTRRQARAIVEESGNFILVYVATPLGVCEKRDQKGLYKKARKGEITEFTGVSSPYETPNNFDIQLDSSNDTPENLAKQVLQYLKDNNYV